MCGLGAGWNCGTKRRSFPWWLWTLPYKELSKEKVKWKRRVVEQSVGYVVRRQKESIWEASFSHQMMWLFLYRKLILGRNLSTADCVILLFHLEMSRPWRAISCRHCLIQVWGNGRFLRQGLCQPCCALFAGSFPSLSAEKWAFFALLLWLLVIEIVGLFWNRLPVVI